MSYDPEKLGAKCSECPLKDHREAPPVKSELRPVGTIIVGDFPGQEETETGRLFVGQSGAELMRGLASQGIPRDAMSYTTAIQCRPPSSDMVKFEGWRKRQNRARKKLGLEPFPAPADCCAPRLQKEIEAHDNVITLGDVPYRQVTGRSNALLDSRGTPIALANGRKVLPTLAPGWVRRRRRWTTAFRKDLGRAFRWFNNALEWQQPEVNIKPTVDEVQAFLHQGATWYVYDVETVDRNLGHDSYDSLTDVLICIGIATPEAAIVIPFRSRDGLTLNYDAADRLMLQALLVDFFTDATRVKVGHNAGSYDRQVIEGALGITPRPLVDTMLLHHVVESELPHKLSFVGSIHTDVHDWKAAHSATEAKTDEELYTYCATDCVVTARITPTLMAAVTATNQTRVVEEDHRVQKMCAGMHRLGLYVDQGRRMDWEIKLRTAKLAREKECRELAGRESMNPGSGMQLQDLLFDTWKLTPTNYTEAGDPSTDDDAIRAFMTSPLVSDKQKAFLDALRRYRRANKYLGTYVLPLRPNTDSEPGRVFPDGRVHPSYNCHGTVSGRLSSSAPNAQNFPVVLRDIITAAPGHVIIGADADQLELRIAASLAGAQMYMRAFLEKLDPHAMTASMVFPDFKNHAPKSPEWENYRNFAKTFAYAVLYGAQVDKVWEIIVSTEDKRTGALPYADIRVDQVRERRDNWLAASPEIAFWWEKVVAEFHRQHYLADPVLGRRRDFLDGPDAPELINFKPQAAGAALMNAAALRIVKEIPFGIFGPGTGLINAMHDAVYVEVPVAKAEFAVDVVRRAMNFEALGVPFTSKPKISLRWNMEAPAP